MSRSANRLRFGLLFLAKASRHTGHSETFPPQPLQSGWPFEQHSICLGATISSKQIGQHTSSARSFAWLLVIFDDEGPPSPCDTKARSSVTLSNRFSLSISEAAWSKLAPVQDSGSPATWRWTVSISLRYFWRRSAWIMSSESENGGAVKSDFKSRDRKLKRVKSNLTWRRIRVHPGDLMTFVNFCDHWFWLIDVLIWFSDRRPKNNFVILAFRRDVWRAS